PRSGPADRGPVLGHGRLARPAAGLAPLGDRDVLGSRALRDPGPHRFRAVDVHDPPDRGGPAAGHRRGHPELECPEIAMADRHRLPLPPLPPVRLGIPALLHRYPPYRTTL